MSSEVTEIRFGGLLDQGVSLAGVLLGAAAVQDGLYAAGSQSQGDGTQGKACKADVVVADDPIDYPRVQYPHLFVAMSQQAYDAYLPDMNPEGVVLFDSSLVKPDDRGGQHGLAVTEYAQTRLDNVQTANVVWLGVVAGVTGWFSFEAVTKALKQHVPDSVLELNQKALSEGLAMGQALKNALEMESNS